MPGTMQAPPTFIRALLDPAAYPHPVREVELLQTHISWVLLTGEVAYKIKKPVYFGFLDASTLEKRRRLCEEELRLNRRFAPQLYLAVVPVGGVPDRPRIGSTEGVFEYAVSMRQFDRREELATLLIRGERLVSEIERFAGRLARLHDEAARDPPDARYGTYDRMRATMLENLAALEEQAGRPADVARLAHLGAWTRDALEQAQTMMKWRRATGAVRECHGDLHGRNIVRWEGDLLPFDCLEFDPALRWMDVASELGFLHVDLVGHDRADLAALLLSGYLEATGDYPALRVLRLYEVYAALVRGKVDGLLALGADSDDAAALAANRRSARIALAERRTRRSTPTLVLMHGLSASGKSWVSRALVPALGLPRVRSDVERKRLAGLPAAADAAAAPEEGLYADRNTRTTYERLSECAEHALDGGYGAIIDAACLARWQRAVFRSVAERTRARLLIVSCHAERATLAERIARRRVERHDPSDATLEILDHQIAAEEPLTADELAVALRIDTDSTSPETAAARVKARLEDAGSCR
jgi:aminoglycoside phosphotransferase family enzyme/predicted kinase